jgi:NADPH2:quinone reductase
MQAIRVNQLGGPDVLQCEEVPTPEPGPGQVRVRVEAAGVNYADIYRRVGLYAAPLPFIPGSEASGTIDAVGEGVTEVAVGDRVASAELSGAYAEYVVAPTRVLVLLPDSMDSLTGAAVLSQGLTAHYLTTSTYPLKPGDVALVHAASGGVGLLLVQIAKRLGARVIGTVSTEEKAALARAAGADEVILYSQEDFTAAARRLTGGRGVDVAYDSVGQTTFMGSIDALRPRGMMVLYGQSSGPVAPFDPQLLNAKGSLFLTRPTLGHYIATPEELLSRTGDLFAWIAAGELQVRIDTTFPLAEAASSHRYMEGRQSKGKVLLIP